MNLIFERGRIVKGKVTGIKNYGIFVVFDNGYKGMIHISEVSNNYVQNLNDYAQIGEIIPSKIIEINYEKKMVKLSLKNLDYAFRREKHYNKEFEILNHMLPKWIDKKLKEIEKKIDQ